MQCASTTIRRVLDPYANIATRRPLVLGGIVVQNHSPPKTVRAALKRAGHDIDSFFFFSSVRNPWDRMASRYFYAKRNANSVWHQFVADGRDFRGFVLDPEIQERVRKHSYAAWFTDDNGREIMNDFVRVESIDEDMARIFKAIGLPRPKLGHVNTNRTEKGYRHFYDDETRAVVAEVYRSDLERFGYVF